MSGRRFRLEDQRRFAALTGDANPIHVDPVAARRLVAGVPVVHGVHLLLWALDELAPDQARQPSRLRVSFDRFLPVDEPARLEVVRQTPERLEAAIVGGGSIRCTLRLAFNTGTAHPRAMPSGPLFAPDAPLDLPLAQLPGLAGRLSPAAPPADFATLFPAAARWLGTDRLAALGAATRLVGMVCPGLHSLFSALALDVTADAIADEGAIGFRVCSVRHGLVTIEVEGYGWTGQLTAARRAPPRRQPTTAELAGRVSDRPFAGQRALVAGGSRGLGEVAAKLLAAGGAEVAVTWSMGEADAAAVAADIGDSGGRCALLRYRVGERLDLAATSAEPPTHGYFFAAPTIARPSSRFFDAARLAELQRFFVDGFWRFATELRDRRADVRLFYPSTVYVEQWPRGLAEYAMAKAAGEMLCAEMNAAMAPLSVTVARLPRLPTDQTAGLVESEQADPVDILLPLLRRFHG